VNVSSLRPARPAIVAVAIGIIVGLLSSGTRAEASERTPLKLPPLSLAEVGGPATIKDTIITNRRPTARSAQAPSGGAYVTADGSRPTILVSPAYLPDPAAGQSLADFFGLLLHGQELNSLVVYVAPYAEMQSLCGADADSCYDSNADTMYLVGETPPDGASIPEIAAHEYGHHVANNRDNSPWYAAAWGPKYWATAQNVCQLTWAGVAYPGDEGEHYAVNPGEAWAETYRVLNAQNPFSWPLLSDLFAPNPKALDAARRDVLSPWGGAEYITRGNRMSRHRQVYRVPVQNDGSIDVSLRTSGSLNADLYIYENRSARKPLAKSVRSGHRDRVTGSICGLRHVLIAVVPRKGRGSYKLRATLPYTTTTSATSARVETARSPAGSALDGPRLHGSRGPLAGLHATRWQAAG
jgi:hypothetical protein